MKSLFKPLSLGCLGAFSLMSSMSAAQDLNFQEYRKFLMHGQGNNNGKKLAIQTSCTTATGTTYRIGEKGYDSCLNSVESSIKTRELQGASEAGNKNKSQESIGATIHIGD